MRITRSARSRLLSVATWVARKLDAPFTLRSLSLEVEDVALEPELDRRLARDLEARRGGVEPRRQQRDQDAGHESRADGTRTQSQRYL